MTAAVVQAQTSHLHRWPGLGHWNLYFLAKFVLLALGLIALQPLPNLLLAALLCAPLPGRSLRLTRQVIAVPAGAALLYHETWLPPFQRLLAQPGVLDFTPSYLLELAGRLIDWQTVALLALLLIAYCYLAQWLRLTSFSLLGLIWLWLPVAMPALGTAAKPVEAAVTASTPLERTQVATDNAALDAWLQRFFEREAGRQTLFPPRNDDAAAFDVLVVNICSLAWEDLDAIGLKDNALLARMDILFDRFNSATSYSGPAAIRLLRASCGQTPHQALYQAAPEQCLLFQNLANLGFRAETLLNHNGRFDGFTDDVTAQGLPQPALPSQRFPRAMAGFDGSPIARDLDVLRGWWNHRQSLSEPHVGLFYNSISLHDGNRILGPDGQAQSADYRLRAQRLLGDLSSFIDELERSGRRVALLIVPEHGAALHGDKMQIAGMREIPRASITQVPVGLKLIGMGLPATDGPLHVTEPSSFLALSELVSRLYAAQSESQTPDLATLVAGLPATDAVSETAGAQVIEYSGRPYVRVNGQALWLPYPNRFE
ncbi:cellulose biosynthesis protein BcsG [Stutzerimonas balearica]|uniref:cellulose biosynthesis protein BcsG n=1 Tax=Stutzerimonas balearica TaxID=74829 RepID=UPI0028AF3566|nr:cellulose biosynthesis protein BcsG [Stutzerimonas balearica]